jgi:uncharacterized damage-inducible protein DinB
MSKQPLQTTFEYLHRAVHTEDGWIHPLRDSIKDVGAEEARWKPSPEVASIWDVTAHATPYLYDVLRALRSEDKVEHEDWHSITDESEAAWVRLRSELLSGIDQLGEEIVEIQEADYLVPPQGRKTPRWEMITDIAVHDSYHAGQIVKLRQLYAASHAGMKEVVAV